MKKKLGSEKKSIGCRSKKILMENVTTRSHRTFARDNLQKIHPNYKKKQSLRYCVSPYRSAVKGIKMSHNNKAQPSRHLPAQS